MWWKLLAPLAFAGGALLHPATGPLPTSSLAVWRDGAWREWWTSASAPSAWTGPDHGLTSAMEWRPLGSGITWSEVRLAGRGEAWRLKLIVARIDPRRATLTLDTAFTAGRARAAWSVDRAPEDAVIAINAGQFARALPWGWVQLSGREFLAPGTGPLSSGIGIDSTGRIRWIDGASIGDPLTRRGLAWGFQSYPTLLSSGGRVPDELQAPGRGIDVAHRDARLAIGTTSDGQFLIALTRFDGVGSALGFVPFGLTTPEMAAVMGALGARDAVMLDGGISSQMLIRDSSGEHRWTGLRKVPLALVVRPRR